MISKNKKNISISSIDYFDELDTKPKKIGDIVINTYEKIVNRSKLGSSIDGITSGFKELDYITNGWQKNQLNVIASPPAIGKTQFALSIVLNAIKQSNENKVVYFNFTHDDYDLSLRILTMESGLSISKLKSGKLNSEEWKILNNTIKKVRDYNIYIIDSPMLSVYEIKKRVEQLVKIDNINMVIIDDYEHISTDFITNREILGTLKRFAKDFKISVFLIVQIDFYWKKISNRKEKRPLLSDLRHHKYLEKYSDIVIFITSSSHGEKSTQKQIIIAKNRSRATGEIETKFDTTSLRFEELCNYEY